MDKYLGTPCVVQNHFIAFAAVCGIIPCKRVIVYFFSTMIFSNVSNVWFSGDLLVCILTVTVSSAILIHPTYHRWVLNHWSSGLAGVPHCVSQFTVSTQELFIPISTCHVSSSTDEPSIHCCMNACLLSMKYPFNWLNEWIFFRCCVLQEIHNNFESHWYRYVVWIIPGLLCRCDERIWGIPPGFRGARCRGDEMTSHYHPLFVTLAYLQ